MENENPFISNKFIPQFELNLVNEKLTNITSETIFQLLRNIRDPEHPYTLEQLNIISIDDIKLYEYSNKNDEQDNNVEIKNVLCTLGLPIKVIEITFTPTVPHCSMAGIIGLYIHYQIKKYIKEDHHVIVKIKKDTHGSYQSLNKQLSDKDRIMAAFENEGIVDMIKSCIDE